MHDTVKNLLNIQNNIKQSISSIKSIKNNPKIIAVSKTFNIDHISHLISWGHQDFGENKVQEALEKWSSIKSDKIKLHLIGNLQTNKVKHAIKLFDFIHSLDSEKLAIKISDEQEKFKIYPKIFIQVNIGNELQKGGINPKKLLEFYNFCKKINLNIIGTMCIPPLNDSSEIYFSRMHYLNKKLNLNEISMGMSSDYLEAIKYGATYLRIGTNIFGNRAGKI